jgi:hypothetical protein
MHITNVTEAYRTSNGIIIMLLCHQHNDCYTAMDYMKQTVWWLAFEGWYNEESAVILTMMTAREPWQMTRCAWQKRILASQSGPLL